MIKRAVYKVMALAALLTAAGVAPANAQDKVGTTGAQFLEIGVSPRADALGGAFTAVADDASAIYYNPAGLVQLENKQAMVSWIDYPADITYMFAGVAMPVGFGGVLGIGYYGLDAGEIDVTTHQHPNGVDGWTFGAKDYALSVSYGRFLTDRFSLGLTLKVIDELYEEERSTGWAADVGTQYNTGWRNFKITMLLSNFGPDMRFISQDYPLPINFKFGGALDVLDNPGHHAIFAIEGSHPADNREKYNVGMEYTFRNFASLRAGQRFEHDLGGMSVGGGVMFNISEKYKARFDYGFQDFDALSEIHRFAMTVDF